jgi:hypothetical protein
VPLWGLSSLLSRVCMKMDEARGKRHSMLTISTSVLVIVRLTFLLTQEHPIQTDWLSLIPSSPSCLRLYGCLEFPPFLPPLNLSGINRRKSCSFLPNEWLIRPGLNTCKQPSLRGTENVP